MFEFFTSQQNHPTPTHQKSEFLSLNCIQRWRSNAAKT